MRTFACDFNDILVPDNKKQRWRGGGGGTGVEINRYEK